MEEGKDQRKINKSVEKGCGCGVVSKSADRYGNQSQEQNHAKLAQKRLKYLFLDRNDKGDDLYKSYAVDFFGNILPDYGEAS